MTLDELKKLFDDHKVVRSTLNAPCSDCYIQGYEEAVQLLWPLVEALKKIELHNSEAINGLLRGFNSEEDIRKSQVILRKSITDLEQKLKGQS